MRTPDSPEDNEHQEGSHQRPVLLQLLRLVAKRVARRLSKANGESSIRAVADGDLDHEADPRPFE